MNDLPRVAETPPIAVASARGRTAALVTASVLVALAALEIPVGSWRIGASDAFAATITNGTIIAFLLASAIAAVEARATRRVPLGVLAIAFVLTAALLSAYAFALPHAWLATAFGLGAQPRAWLWIAWHTSFAIGVGAYAWSEWSVTRGIALEGQLRFARDFAAGASIGVAIVLAIVLRFAHVLPTLVGGRGSAVAFHANVGHALLAAGVIALGALVAVTRLRTATGLWLAVALVAFAVDLFASAGLGVGRATFAWYAGLVIEFVMPAVVLVGRRRRFIGDGTDTATTHGEPRAAALALALAGSSRPFDRELAEAAVACRFAGEPLALVLLDLDHFEDYGMHFGKRACDVALAAVGTALAAVCFRKTDAWHHVESDTFGVILRGSDLDAAQAAAERVREAIMRLRIEQAPQAGDILTTSIGYTIVNDARATDHAAIYAAASRALDRAKYIGRNRIVTYDRPRTVELVAV